MTKGERESFGNATVLEAFETDVGGTEAEVDKVLGDGVVIFGVDVGDEFEEGVLEGVGYGEGHAPV